VRRCTEHRQQSRSLCRKRSTVQAPPYVPGLPPLTTQSRCSGTPCTAKVRRNGRGVCVARYYDPATGQFLSVDPDVAETDAPFSYAGDDPVNQWDPLGLADVGIRSESQCELYSNDKWVPKGSIPGNGHCIPAPEQPLIDSVFHYVAHHYGAIISVVAGGVCIFVSAGLCVVAIAVGTAAEIAQSATNGTFTPRGAAEIVLLGAAAAGTAGIGKIVEVIGDEALPLSSGAEKFTQTLPYTATVYGTRTLASTAFTVPVIPELQSPCP
jgi:hypothetical protein